MTQKTKIIKSQTLQSHLNTSPWLANDKAQFSVSVIPRATASQLNVQWANTREYKVKIGLEPNPDHKLHSTPFLHSLSSCCYYDLCSVDAFIHRHQPRSGSSRVLLCAAVAVTLLIVYVQPHSPILSVRGGRKWRRRQQQAPPFNRLLDEKRARQRQDNHIYSDSQQAV